MLYDKEQRPIKIVDIGASYGIISTLLLHDLTMAQLIDFFIKRDGAKEPTWAEIELSLIHISEPTRLV